MNPFIVRSLEFPTNTLSTYCVSVKDRQGNKVLKLKHSVLGCRSVKQTLLTAFTNDGSYGAEIVSLQD